MEVNGSGGRLDRKTSKEKSVKKTSPTEKNIAGSVKPGKPSARKYVWAGYSDVQKSIAGVAP